MEGDKKMLEMFNIPAVTVKDGFVVDSNDRALELFRGSGNPVVVPLIGDRSEIDGVMYRLTSQLSGGSTLYLLANKSPDSSLDNLLLGMSYKLREELNTTLGSLAVLHRKLDENSSAEQMDSYFAMLLRSQMKLLRMTANLDEAFADEDSEPKLYSVDLDELCGNLTNTTSILLDGKYRLIYENKLGGESPVTAAEPRKLESMLMNLISNSALHLVPNTDGVIRIILATNDAGFRIIIKDNGSGFDNNMESMFAKYSRNDTTRGTVGLGLAAALHIARLHGGNILASSDAKETSFSVSLPRKDVEGIATENANVILYDDDAMQRILSQMAEVVDSSHFLAYI
ncbi:MAG: sensor histidine kinase [Oscillospiraceae bacterium]|jgi:signal transduction histidine kinase|nr:sensor histidine kinase [Oscillospiraceae bacterium]